MIKLSEDLARLAKEIADIARGYDLDFFDTIFEVLDYDQINIVAAQGGFPVRYPYWRHGMEYEQLSKGYAYGLQKIYEMVINNDPCYAYLLECNNLVDQKLVIAHVYGHCDFFKNNFWFAHTNRRMMDEMANHSTRISRYMDKYGVETVETFMDTCMSIENLIDRHSPYIRRKALETRSTDAKEEVKEADDGIRRLKADHKYMEHYINPKEYIDQQKQKIIDDAEKQIPRFPHEPERDIMKFMMDYAPLAPWQRDILAMFREESYYFAPQAMTKIMNEGWASYWHSTILTQQVLNDSEIIDFADHHSGTVATSPGRINPYKLGIELFRDIEDRWNKGKFGKEYEDCDDYRERKNWNRATNLGREKIFEVRKMHNDITFIDTFMTEDFCYEQKLFTYAFNKRTGMYEIVDRDYRKVKQKLLQQLTNFGQPFIYVEDANFENRSELLLTHDHQGVDLQFDHAVETLKSLQILWGRPVNIQTKYDGQTRLLSWNGKEFKESTLSEGPQKPKEEDKK